MTIRTLLLLVAALVVIGLVLAMRPSWWMPAAGTVPVDFDELPKMNQG